ncbi:pseudouridine synthase [Marinobacter daepoensis]|uniref:Pseudouridine synthase n=1 Tax=Marinobacter daepoensis TaxID=262077 RepID=A0ABS3BEH1_9GAMM|nr:pseudouridine synthase [Marinobacter daepoensis]MBN7770235.1 pseudouridine synthase [Marinobacter daepoensis]MBY6033765.1 pseudouridine synthase [Marinobacter daepoensis]MBY6079681.1 pseudouridine synthase [Marinobacter daepoensis]
MRLDQYLASSTGLSRKDAKKAISAGRVTVDGEICRQSNRHLEETPSVGLDGQPVLMPGELYLMMHKPAGVLSATTDSSQPTAIDLLPGHLASRVHIAGRLDKDTTGLLLLTSDGQWSHRVTSPRRHCPKTYRVTLAETLPESARQALEQGVLLKGENSPTRPATASLCDADTLELTISEGRYHQVKRMLAAVGNHVDALHRVRIGEIALDPHLSPGEFRALTQEEIRSVTNGG